MNDFGHFLFGVNDLAGGAFRQIVHRLGDYLRHLIGDLIDVALGEQTVKRFTTPLPLRPLTSDPKADEKREPLPHNTTPLIFVRISSLEHVPHMLRIRDEIYGPSYFRTYTNR